jgi:hypothetical protein
MELQIKNYILEVLLKSKKGVEIDNKSICLMVNNKFALEGPATMSPIKVRAVVNELRREEIPVIGNSRGYYVSYSPDDIASAIVSLQSRIEAINSAIVGLRGCLTNVLNDLEEKNEGIY